MEDEGDDEDDDEDEPSLDESLEACLAKAVQSVGVARYLDAPLIYFDERCFPDPWEPSLRGVRTALLRLLRHARMPDVPVVLDDARTGGDPEGLLHEPVLFDGIEDGAACFIVQAIGEPRSMVPWLALEVVRAWAEYQGIDRERSVGYRALGDEPDPELLPELEASVFGVALGLGPLLTFGAIQTHKLERVDGRMVHSEWASQTVGGLHPPALVRLVALHAVSRGAVPEELARLREAIDEDLRRVFDHALAERGDDAAQLREALGLPAELAVERAPLDLSPLPAVEDEALVAAEREHEERRRFFNRGREVHAVIERGTGMGIAAGAMPLAVLVPLLLNGWISGVTLGVAFLACLGLGGVWGHRATRLRCSDKDCRGIIGPKDPTCPACGGTVAGQLRSANDRFADEE
jgi:hypothetical protein